MNREEILERNRKSKPVDEGEQYVEDKSRNVGEIGIIMFFIILFVYKEWKGIPTEDLIGLFWGYLGFSYIGKFKYYRTKRYLVCTILGLLGALIFITSYMLKMW
ncbi:DUF6442 family protein [uncultured Clostridium sp.]|uniref:DUF6442 family protein n=1 Tax=uncultured Clostridium sp. TaxID=59620 RepID=UPI0025D6944A|nr:DUF6442 family protein [uncultured Clostridium sp.]